MLEFSPAEAESLIEQHRHELYSFLVRRVNCNETANDLLQDTFFRLINVKTAQPIQNPRAFIYRPPTWLPIICVGKRVIRLSYPI